MGLGWCFLIIKIKNSPTAKYHLATKKASKVLTQGLQTMAGKKILAKSGVGGWHLERHLHKFRATTNPLNMNTVRDNTLREPIENKDLQYKAFLN